jgi:DNA-binding NarL/FixJ family response regulator
VLSRHSEPGASATGPFPRTTPAIRLLLADDHTLVRESVRTLLEREGFDVVADVADGREAVRLTEELKPDVAVLDVGMPVLNGLDAADQIQRVVPATRIVLLTMHAEEQYVAAALRAGVRGFLLKSQVLSDLVRAIEEVASGGMYLSPRVSQIVVEASLGRRDIESDPLSPREREVLQLIAEGSATREIAVALGISPKTAESHRAGIMRKLGIHGVAGLVRYAIRRGLVTP